MSYKHLTWETIRVQWLQNIFDVTALEILPASKLQILGQALPTVELQQYCVSTNLTVHTFVDTGTVQKPM